MGNNQNSDNPGREIIPVTTPKETALDTAAAVSAMLPLLGGPISDILSGMAQDQRLGRVNEVLWGLSERVKELSEASEAYVKTEDFQDLLDETLRMVSRERNEEKRRIYRDFLIGAIESPGEPYDEQIRFLRTLEQLQADHIRVLQAFIVEPDPDPPGFSGSLAQTLQHRLPDMKPDRIADLAEQLNDLKLTIVASLQGMMTAAGAQDLRSRMTPFGQRFTRFIEG